MNERIKELEKLATEVEHSHGAFGEYEKYYRLNPEKFAELIVRECMSYMEDGDIDFAKFMIKKHFGVEE